MYLLIEISYNILIQCHGIYFRVKKVQIYYMYMFENDILRNYSLVFLRGWVSKRHLAKILIVIYLKMTFLEMIYTKIGYPKGWRIFGGLGV